MKDARIQNEYHADTALDLLDESVMEDRAEHNGKQRKCPKRDKETVREGYYSHHYQERKRADPVFRTVRTVLGPVGKSGDKIYEDIYSERDKDPELYVGFQRLSQILDNVVVNGNSDL
jgi:hypothetical protein